MDRVRLVRHCATEWSGIRYAGRADLPLTGAGERQAEELARSFVPLAGTVPVVYSSPARRARATAAPIAAALGTEVRLDARLWEVDFGAIEGLRFSEVARDWPDIAREVLAGRLAIDWPSGETAHGFLGRVAEFAGHLERLAQPEAIVVSHSGTLRALLDALRVERGREPIPTGTVIALERAATWQITRQETPASGTAALG